MELRTTKIRRGDARRGGDSQGRSEGGDSLTLYLREIRRAPLFTPEEEYPHRMRGAQR